MHEYALSSLKSRPIKQPLPRSQRANGNRGGLDMRQTGRFWGNTGRLCNAVLCQCAIRKPVIHAVDFLAGIKAGRILTHSRNDAGELMSWYSAATSLAVFAMRGRIPL